MKPGLPDERKALAERYTIDAEEAELRAQQAAEAQAQREVAEEQARRAAEEEQARREAAEAQAQREAAEEQARREEAEERARLEAAEAQAQREAAEAQAQREAAERLARQEAMEAEARRREAEEHAREAAVLPAEEVPDVVLHDRTEALVTPEAADPPPVTDQSESETEVSEPDVPAPTNVIPIYRWVQRADPDENDSADWPRSLVRTKEEARRDEPSRG